MSIKINKYGLTQLLRALITAVITLLKVQSHHNLNSCCRAIFNLPLGSTKLKMPAVMINLLGEPGYEGKVRYEGLTECLAVEGVKIHLYGKKTTKPFRKMGHVTVLSPTIDEAKSKADFVKQKLKVVSW